MRRLIKAYGPCALPDREFHPFDTLARSIIGQQLSSKAADTIRNRIVVLVGEPFAPAKLLQANVEHLRTAGLSAAKVRYIRELADRTLDSRLSFDLLTALDDDSVIAKLTEVPGIGRWTAEMFLIFGLKRPDVLALSDAGLQRAARILYGGRGQKTSILEKVSDSWRPYRSVASWYLWEHLDSGT
jgi:DNA-3-methyladenine glycosylase II